MVCPICHGHRIPHLLTAVILPKHFCEEILHLLSSDTASVSQAGTLPASCLSPPGEGWFLLKTSGGSLAGNGLSPSGCLLRPCPPGSLLTLIFIILNDNAVSTQEGSLNSQMVAGFFLPLISFHLIAVQVRGGGVLLSSLNFPPCNQRFLQEPLTGLLRLGEFQRGKVVGSST